MSLARYRQLSERIVKDQDKKTSSPVLLSYSKKIARMQKRLIISRDWEKLEMISTFFKLTRLIFETK